MKVTPEGLLNYKLQPLVDIDPIAAPATSSTVPLLEPKVDEEDEGDNFEGENEHGIVEIVRDDDIPIDHWIFGLFDMTFIRTAYTGTLFEFNKFCLRSAINSFAV